MIIGTICLVAAIVLAVLGVPLAFALLSVSLVGIGISVGWSTAWVLLPLTLSDAVTSYDLAMVPMFILMGNIVSKTGLAEDLFRAAYAFFGQIPGGLALTTMVASAGFSSVCGSSVAAVATMSKVSYPSMQKYGYSDELASATIAAGGTLGILIPPSIVMVIYGILTQTNIGHLFVAGIIPGLIGLVMYMAAICFVVWRDPSHAPQGDLVPSGEKLRSLAGVWPFIMLCGLIIGGLYANLFSPTESAGIGAGLAIVIAAIRRRLSLSAMRAAFVETAYTSTALYTILFGALMLSKLLSLSGMADGILDFVEATGFTGGALMVVVLLVFLVLGCVMDSFAMIFIFVPLFTPLVVSQGYDLIWFGVIVVVVAEIALITPPVGMNVFMLKAALPHVPILTIFRGLVPFIVADLVRLVILVSFPVITLWLVGGTK